MTKQFCAYCKVLVLRPRRYCSRACANKGTKSKPVKIRCKNPKCRKEMILPPAIAARRKFCSRSCNAKVNRNCSVDVCRKAGAAAIRVRFTQWWARMMESVGAVKMTPQAAFRAGYLVGYKRGARRARALED